MHSRTHPPNTDKWAEILAEAVKHVCAKLFESNIGLQSLVTRNITSLGWSPCCHLITLVRSCTAYQRRPATLKWQLDRLHPATTRARQGATAGETRHHRLRSETPLPRKPVRTRSTTLWHLLWCFHADYTVKKKCSSCGCAELFWKGLCLQKASSFDLLV